MTSKQHGRVATDNDSTWCAWITGSATVRAMSLQEGDERDIFDAGNGTAVHGGARTGRFLIQDGETLRAWEPEIGSRDVGTITPGALLLEPVGHVGTFATATARDGLVLFTGDETLLSLELGAPPLLLEWQQRRRKILCVLADGTVHRIDTVTRRSETSFLSTAGDYRLACYDEILGGVWTVPESEPGIALFHRTETDPHVRIYRMDIGLKAEAVRSSHSGEWFIARAPEQGPTRLTNVNSGRTFTVPGELAERGVPCVFSFDNQLVSVEEDTFETLPVPARADVRSRDGSLAIDTFWSAPPRMHRASRRRGEPRAHDERQVTRATDVRA